MRFSGRMCGRFALTLPPDAVAGWFGASLRAEFETPRYNICPTQMIPVVVHHDGARLLVEMRWGFIPHWYKTPSDGPLLINARSETITQKPSFRAAVKTRRCLIPATGFYEWHAKKGVGKEPWFIKPSNDELMAFAGVWQSWTDAQERRHITCAIVTADASPDLVDIHHREPVTVRPDDFRLWLGEDGKGAAGLMQAAPDGFFETYRVSTDVNKARHDSADLMEPLVQDA